MTFASTSEQIFGTINEVLSRDILHSVENDGDHTYLSIQEESKSQLPINSESMNVIVPLTNPNLDVVCFDKSFITLKVAVKFNFSRSFQYEGVETLLTRAVKLFIGLKHSTDCIGEYSIYHKGKQITGTLQSNGTAESFLYHTYRSQESLSNRRGIHSVASIVSKGDRSSSCGEFIKFSQLNGHDTITIPFTFTIPFNDILCFQQFREYPSKFFGDLELRFKFNKNAFVFMQVDPEYSIKSYRVRHKLQGDSITDAIIKLTPAFFAQSGAINYNHEYTQVGDPSDIIHTITAGGGVINMQIGSVTMSADSIEISECYTTMMGYRINPEAAEEMQTKFESEPWVKFSQNINYLPFSTGASSSQLFVNQQTYLNNVTDFILVFPRTQHEITVSKNPLLQDLSLNVMNRKYPEMPLDTTSERFAQMMMNSSDCFNQLPNYEYAQSLNYARADEYGSNNPMEDLTSFLLTLKVERPSAMGLICDGLDSKGQQVSVRLTAKPKYPGANDEYCAQQPPPPVLYTVSDSFFIFNAKDGGQCIYSDRDFNEVVEQFMS